VEPIEVISVQQADSTAAKEQELVGVSN